MIYSRIISTYLNNAMQTMQTIQHAIPFAEHVQNLQPHCIQIKFLLFEKANYKSLY